MNFSTGDRSIFLGKGGGCQNLEFQGAPSVIRPPQKFRGVETPVRAMYSKGGTLNKNAQITVVTPKTWHENF